MSTRLFKQYVLLCCLLASDFLYADNWHASISSSARIDNRYSPDNKLFADVMVNYAYDDDRDDIHGRFAFLAQSSEFSFDNGSSLYNFYVEKGGLFPGFKLKAGRFERSDNLGLYFLDGLNVNYQDVAQGYRVEAYLGKPRRMDDVRSIEGDYLLGFEVSKYDEASFDHSLLSKFWHVSNLRLGLQKLKNDHVAHRFNLALDVSGKPKSMCTMNCQVFQSYMLMTYHIEEQNVEDLMLDVKLPLNRALRLGLAYEYYRPVLDTNPGFRERFYSYYDFGKQKLSKVNINYLINHQLSASVDAVYSHQEQGADGSGYSLSLNIKNPLSKRLNQNLSLTLDTVEIGEDKLASFSIGFRQYVNSRLTVDVDSIYRTETKSLLGDNRVFGLNGKITYMVKNNFLLSLEARKISNSRLRDEHMYRLNMTYYFDNYKPKSKASNISRLNVSGH